MPAISTKVDVCQGHDACPPREFVDHSPDVRAEGFHVTREDDGLASHGCPEHTPHGATVTAGYPSVRANGKRVAYIGANVDCSSEIVKTGRPSVLLGEGRGRAGGFPAESSKAAPVRSGDAKKPTSANKGAHLCRGRLQYAQQTPATCGIASVRMVVNGVTSQNVTEQQVARTANGFELWTTAGQNFGPVYASSQGSFAEGLPAVLKEYGVESYSTTAPEPMTTADVNRITANGTQPAIVSVYGSRPGIGHIVVVDGIDKNGNVMVRNPGRGGSEGCQTWSLAEFNKRRYPGSRVLVLGQPPPGHTTPFVVKPRAK